MLSESKSRNELKCATCRMPFVPKKNYQLFCSDLCDAHATKIMNDLLEHKLTVKCSKCRGIFKKPNTRSFSTICETCVYSSRQKSNRRMINKRREASLQKETKKQKKVSYEELNRRMEYKRVMTDSDWNCYLKGKKGDRI